MSHLDHPDSHVALDEAKRLIRVLNELNYYRFKHCIYDGWLYKPLYTLSEFVWAFTSLPNLASVTIDHFYEQLPDVPNVSKTASKNEIIIIAKDMLNENERLDNITDATERKNKRAINVSKLFRFLFQKHTVSFVVNHKQFCTTVISKLKELLEKSDYLPASNFLHQLDCELLKNTK